MRIEFIDGKYKFVFYYVHPRNALYTMRVKDGREEEDRISEFCRQIKVTLDQIEKLTLPRTVQRSMVKVWLADHYEHLCKDGFPVDIEWLKAMLPGEPKQCELTL